MSSDVRYPVNLLLGQNWRQSGQWRFPRWRIISVLPADTGLSFESPDCTQVHTSENENNYLWQGLWLEFFRDGLQAYYDNLTGSRPSLFVLCHERDEKPELAPISISANLTDAEAHMESDGTVLVTALVDPFSSWLANYVLQNRSVFEHQLDRLHRDKKGKHRHV